MSALDLDEVLSIVTSPGWSAAKRLGAAGWKTAEALAILARREREVANRARAKIASMRREINALAGLVGDAIVRASLAPGERSLAPEGHALTTAVDGLRGRAERAELALAAMTTRAHEAEAEVLPRIEELELALEEAQAEALTRETDLLEQLALATESAAP